MEKKQTAVDWYANASHELIVKKSKGEITEREFLTMHHNLFYEAKAMYKQQVMSFTIKAVSKAINEDINNLYNLDELYNETFGGQDNE